MKKTIISLLATVGLATAVTAEPLDITWNDNTASLTEVLDSVSVVFTLDFASVAINGPLDWGVDTEIFSWSGVAEDNYATGGVTLYNLDDYYFNEYISELYFTAPGNSGGFGTTNVIGYTKAVIGYTYGPGEVAAAYLTLIDAEGNQKEYAPAYGTKMRDSLMVTTLTKNSAVGDIEVYGSILSAEEMAAAMTNLAAPNTPSEPTTPSEPEPTPSVPEPTTATLSLLALAALAGRRRRR